MKKVNSSYRKMSLATLLMFIVFAFFSLGLHAGPVSVDSEVVYSNAFVMGGRYSSHKAACAALNNPPTIVNSQPGACGFPSAESSCECIYDSGINGISGIVGQGWATRDNACPEGMAKSAGGGFPTTCIGSPEKNDSCLLAGNPIHILNGNKIQREQDISLSNGLNVSRYYNSSLASNPGSGWSFSFASKRLLIGETDILIVDADGYVDPWSKASGTWVGDPDSKNRVQDTASVYQVQRANNDIETYDRSGRLLSIVDLSGLELSYAYNLDIGNLESISNQFGQSLQITTNDQGQITEIQSATGERVQYEYEQTRLASVIFDDDTLEDDNDNPKRVFHYESPQAKLTGITDERGNRYATWEYDSQGRAISSEHHNNSERTTLEYFPGIESSQRTTVTNSLGKQTTYHYTTLHNLKKVTQVEGHQSANCAAANKNYTYHPSGMLETKTDWKNNTTSYQYNTRNLESSRTEALGTPQERTITTEWHPIFNLRTKVTEPGRETNFTYDAEGRMLAKVSNELPLD